MQWDILFFFNSMLLGVGLAMDAFSVSLANGLNEPHMSRRRMLGIAGVFFEAHPQPDQALSDGPNSLDMKQVTQMTRQLSRLDALVKTF